jgi:hypothetical protein
MGFLDELKDKAEEFGEKAQEAFGTGKDKAEEVIENVKDRFDNDETQVERAGEAADVSSDAVSDAAMGIEAAVANTTDTARSTVDDATDSEST